MDDQGKVQLAVNEKIEAAKQAGIVLAVMPPADEDGFHRARAHYAGDTNRVCCAFNCDPLRAIQSVVDQLVCKTSGTTLQ